MNVNTQLNKRIMKWKKIQIIYIYLEQSHLCICIKRTVRKLLKKKYFSRINWLHMILDRRIRIVEINEIEMMHELAKVRELIIGKVIQ